MLSRQQGQRFECATWLHKARQMLKAEFQREGEKKLTGKDSEPSELANAPAAALLLAEEVYRLFLC
jgi:hypothetical protein